MSRNVVIEVLTTHCDPRGSVFEPLVPDALPAQRNVHVVTTEPGAVRGNHFHPRGTEVLAVIGPALVRTRQDGETTDTEVPEGAVYRFTIPPGISHAIKNTAAVPTITVAFNSEVHDPNNPDLVRDVLL
ncbi:polysaccharide biosynthesis C-terminal domain-containing protein [Verrucomicrobiota bacterium sgz303538]